MKGETIQKIRLTRETLRVLDDSDLKHEVEGGRVLVLSTTCFTSKNSCSDVPCA